MKYIPEIGLIVALVTTLILSGCSSAHQKNVSFGFGVYQAEYYDLDGGKN